MYSCCLNQVYGNSSSLMLLTVAIFTYSTEYSQNKGALPRQSNEKKKTTENLQREPVYSSLADEHSIGFAQSTSINNLPRVNHTHLKKKDQGKILVATVFHVAKLFIAFQMPFFSRSLIQALSTTIVSSKITAADTFCLSLETNITMPWLHLIDCSLKCVVFE